MPSKKVFVVKTRPESPIDALALALMIFPLEFPHKIVNDVMRSKRI